MSKMLALLRAAIASFRVNGQAAEANRDAFAALSDGTPVEAVVLPTAMAL